jgi:release factor glutamine methyltransferase
VPVARALLGHHERVTGTATTSDIVTALRAAGCVFAEEEAELLVMSAGTSDELATMVDRRVSGEPLEYILGWAEFCGLRIAVDPGVFVPRRRTEFLVHQALAVARDPALSEGLPALSPVVVDLCCGTGALGVALVDMLGPAELHAVDLDPVAVCCAQRNVTEAGGHVYEGDLYAPLPPRLKRKVDVLIVNAPYVPTDAVGLLPPEARLHEPRVALDGGTDGLDVQRRVIADASDWLRPGGHLLIETSDRQASDTLASFQRHGLIARMACSDELDATVVIGTPPLPVSAARSPGGT